MSSKNVVLSGEVLIIRPRDDFPRPLALSMLTELHNLAELISHFQHFFLFLD